MSDGRQPALGRKVPSPPTPSKRPNKIAGGQCRRCLNDLYAVDIENKSWKDAVQAAEQLQAIAETPRQKSNAEVDVAQALVKSGGDKPRPQVLDAAHTALHRRHRGRAQKRQRALQRRLRPRPHGPHRRRRQGVRHLRRRPQPEGVLRTRAQHFADNPALAANKMAPPFQVTTLDGQNFNLDEMSGKVVLLDFWATWCGPCNDALPDLKHIAKKFANDPLVILSISSDSDDATWRAFVAKNGMTWPQYRDKNGHLSHIFEIEGIPHYFTIDTDGVLTAEQMGSNSDVESKIAKLIKKGPRSQARHRDHHLRHQIESLRSRTRAVSPKLSILREAAVASLRLSAQSGAGSVTTVRSKHSRLSAQLTAASTTGVNYPHAALRIRMHRLPPPHGKDPEVLRP